MITTTEYRRKASKKSKETSARRGEGSLPSHGPSGMVFSDKDKAELIANIMELTYRDHEPQNNNHVEEVERTGRRLRKIQRNSGQFQAATNTLMIYWTKSKAPSPTKYSKTPAGKE